MTVFVNPITWGAYRAYTRQITIHSFENVKNVKTREQKHTARREHLEYFVKFVLKLRHSIKWCAYSGIYASIISKRSLNTGSTETILVFLLSFAISIKLNTAIRPVGHL